MLENGTDVIKKDTAVCWSYILRREGDTDKIMSPLYVAHAGHAVSCHDTTVPPIDRCMDGSQKEASNERTSIMIIHPTGVTKTVHLENNDLQAASVATA